ncbi:MAG TPA: type II secretion system protein [Xanthobacteraceae bacterium]|nr:type II secretion system protein [Xanthobacteraceae bacterium]
MRTSARAGFTLLEALVALTLVLAFAAALGPLLFTARRTLAHAEQRVAAQALLRTLIEAPRDRSRLSGAPVSGEAAGLQWRVAAEPIFVAALVPPPATQPAAGEQKREHPRWIAYRLVASVSWGPGEVVRAETVRLAKAP